MSKTKKRRSPTLLLIFSSLKAMTAKPMALWRGDVKYKLKFFGFALLFIYAFGVMALMAAGMAYLLCISGASNAVLPTFGMITSIMILMTSFFRGSKSIFAPKDYDFLMSVPVPKRSITISALAADFINDSLFTLILFIPAAAVYAVMTRPSAVFYILIIPSLLMIPLIPAVIGSIFGVLVSFISSRMKHKNFVTVVLQLLLFLAIFGISFISGTLAEDQEMMISMITMISDRVKSIYYPAHLLGLGLGGSIIPWLIFALSSLLLAVGFVLFSSKFYRQIHNFITDQPKKDTKKERKIKNHTAALKINTPMPLHRSLLCREFKRYFSIPVYVLNTIIGPILIIVFAAVFAFVPMTSVFEVGSEDAMPPEEFLQFMYSLLPSLLVFPVTMTTASASSVSLEGESRYILKSSPIQKRDIYSAKVLHNLILLLPAIVLSWIMLLIRSFSIGIGITELITLLILPTAFAVFVSVFGLWCNLKHQKYDWKTEIDVVKQSTAVMITVFVGMGLTLINIMLTAFLSFAGGLILFGAQMLLSAVILALSYLFWRLSLKSDIK